MDNKDFEEVEDIFGEDLGENYDVPVYEPIKNDVDTNSVNEIDNTDSVPVYNIDTPVEPVYNDNSTIEVKPIDSIYENTTLDNNTNTYEDISVNEDTTVNSTDINTFEVQPDITSVENNTTQSDFYEVQPDVSKVEPEPVYEENAEVNYGPVALEPSYEEEVNVHPDAVVSLNNSQEDKLEDTKIEDIPAIKLGDNQSLKFVFIIGIIILIAIFLLPLLNRFSI